MRKALRWTPRRNMTEHLLQGASGVVGEIKTKIIIL